ncbi:MAG TPA: 2-hydroxyacid dehydrogenase [Stellaceae bacterium]|jgi:lactate dehydrogenase-like 2-hydroxyacid dehydrogenase
MKIEIVVAPRLYQPVMTRLEREFAIHPLWDAKDVLAFLAPLADQVRGLASFTGYPVPASLIAALPKLEIIATMSVGTDHIDLAAARARGIAVTNAPDVLTDCVADLGMALTLNLARNLIAADRFVREGKWQHGLFPLATKLGGATMGIVGLGRIGKAVAQRAAGFGMRIVYFGRHPQPDTSYPFYDDLAAMARDSDYLMLTCPGGEATRNLVDARIIAALGPDGRLVNIARGSVVDQAALIEALTARRLAGAALDVYAEEPRVPAALIALDNVVLAPHIASATHATRAAMGDLMIDNLLAHFAGRPLLTRVV